MVVRSATPIGAGFETRIRTQLARRIGHAAGLVERISVRFEDVNGPKGGVDTVCRIKVVMSGRPSLVVEKRASSHAKAFAQAVSAVSTSVRREQGKHRLATGPRPGPRPAPRKRPRATEPDAGELIGRRVGRGPDALSRALQRPEKRHRATYVDTAAVGTSASDRRAGGPYAARRNTLARTTRATATLEDSRTRPSRKSTRRSANRGKPSQTKERAVASRMHAPGVRSSRRG